MNLGAVMDDLAAALGGIDDLRVYPYWVDRVTPPAAVVAWPDPLEYDATQRRGSDRFTVPVVVLSGRVDARSSRDRVAAYADGSGPRSVKAVVEAHTPTAYDTATVTRCEFGVHTVAGVEYLAATFDIDITGSA